MASATTVVGFKWEADIYCYNCTRERFGEPADQVSPWVGVLDNEGNEVGAIFGNHEFDYEPHCRGCREPIDAVHLQELGEGAVDVRVVHPGRMGSIFTLEGLTGRGREWLAENLAKPVTIGPETYVCESRYVEDIIAGMIGDGLEVEGVKDGQVGPLELQPV